MKRILIIMFLIIFATILFSGCAPKGNPQEVIDKYYQSIIDGNFEDAYNSLSEANKKNISKDDFIIFIGASNESQKLKSYKAVKNKELKKAQLDNIEYQNVVEFNITETCINYADGNKEENISYPRNVVNDNGVWKVHREGDFKKTLSSRYALVARMYMEGKGKDKNLNEAARYYNEAIKADPLSNAPYYGLGLVYSDLMRYDEAIEKMNTFISKTSEDEPLSDAYNVLGLCYLGKAQRDKAREAFNMALEYNSGNEYAKTNLKSYRL